MTEKICTECGREFVPYHPTADKTCSKGCNRARRARKQREKRAANPDYWRERHLKDPKRLRRWARANPEKASASGAVRRAVAAGDIEKPEVCEGCGKAVEPRKLHGHHEDYSKPLDVAWLCARCHRAKHLGPKSLAGYFPPGWNNGHEENW